MIACMTEGVSRCQLDEAASPRDGGSGLGGRADWEEVEPPVVLV